MMRSYSAQRRTKTRPENIIKTLSIILPDNTSEELKNEIYSVLGSEQFNKLPILLSARRSLVDPSFKRNARERGVKDRSIDIGYVRNFDPENESFTVMIFGFYAEDVFDIMNPAVEVVFSELNGSLRNISKLNIISLGPNNYSYDPEKHKDKDRDNAKSFERHHNHETHTAAPAPTQKYDTNDYEYESVKPDRTRNRFKQSNPYPEDDDHSDEEDTYDGRSNDAGMGTLGDLLPNKDIDHDEAIDASD